MVTFTAISQLTCLTFGIELSLNRAVDHLGHPLLYTPEERCPTFQPTPVYRALAPCHASTCILSQAGDPFCTPAWSSAHLSDRHHWNSIHPCFNKNQFYTLIRIWWHTSTRQQNCYSKRFCAAEHLMFSNKTDQVIL